MTDRRQFFDRLDFGENRPARPTDLTDSGVYKTDRSIRLLNKVNKSETSDEQPRQDEKTYSLRAKTMEEEND